ncbi:MAG: DNA-3-methyladenine glycosylase 2 family protein [Microbacteriaceae bacterium]|jgi:DNA-3-methyladenine glycosylase II|nr:DNA-3-methyladenine glycosylase 2 family protein [Microbacteriaceae bacterium]
MGLDLTRAQDHLSSSCDVMAALITLHTPPDITPKPPEQYFSVLVSSIVGQQLSVKAAETIEGRVLVALGPHDPGVLAHTSVEALRELGLSRSKASYIIAMAEAFLEGTIDPQALAASDSETVIEALTSLKGIGPWTAEMFLIFGMGQPDVWSPGDLGLKKAVWAHFGEGVDTSEIAQRWRPFRSYAALYLWEFTDNRPQ